MDVSPHAISVLILASGCISKQFSLYTFVLSLIDPPSVSITSFKDPTLQELFLALQAHVRRKEKGEVKQEKDEDEGEEESAHIFLVKKLKELCEYPDQLIDFFDEMTEIINPTISLHNSKKSHINVDTSSLLGIYTRKHILAFNLLMFDGVARLFDALKRYVNTFQQQQQQQEQDNKEDYGEFKEKKNNGDEKTELKKSLSLDKQETKTSIHKPSSSSSSSSTDPYCFTVSHARHQAFVRKQTEAIQANMGRVSYAETEQLIHELSQCGNSIQVYFLRYLNCQHHKEFEDALESLHCYFDHLTPQGDKRSIHQYAILNLAILHYSFGHYEQATHAAEETVRIAQQFNDHVCLAHALALLGSISRHEYGDSPQARQFVKRCVTVQSIAAKIKQEREQYVMLTSDEEPIPSSPPVPAVESTSWLALAKFELDHIHSSKGQSDPQAVWNALRNSAELNTTHSLHSLMSTNFLMRSGTWKLFGSSYLSNLYATIQLRHYGTIAAATDTCLAVSSLIGNPQSLDQDVSILQEFSSTQWPYKAVNGLEELTLINSFQKAVVNGYLEQARAISCKLSDLAPSYSANAQFYLEARLAQARLKHAQGEYELAIRLTEEIVLFCEKRKDHTGTVQCLLLMSQICQDAGDALLALPYVLKCLGLCKDLTLDSLEARVRLTLAKIHLLLGSAREAVDTVVNVLPHLLENGEAIDEVEAYSVLGRAMLSLSEEHKETQASSPQSFSALAASLLQPPPLPSSLLSTPSVPLTPCTSMTSPVSTTEQSQKKRSQFLSRALHYLELAAARCDEARIYSSIAKEVFYLLARLYHHFDRISDRDTAALRFSKSRP